MAHNLVIDCGGTSCDYAIDGKQYSTSGFNFARLNPRDFNITVQEVPDNVYLYGAGITDDRRGDVEARLHELFPSAHVQASSDLFGAARTLFGDGPGIACIFGTGSNSCQYDGTRIVAHVPPLGYVLGDEASGAALGKAYVTAYLKGLFSAETKAKLPILTEKEVLQNVYRGPSPQSYLASFCPTIAQHTHLEEVAQLVEKQFMSFFQRNMHLYDKSLPVGAIGSVAYHFKPFLFRAMQAQGYTMGPLLQSPLPALADYHDKKNKAD